jgi:hypothetical protein
LGWKSFGFAGYAVEIISMHASMMLSYYSLLARRLHHLNPLLINNLPLLLITRNAVAAKFLVFHARLSHDDAMCFAGWEAGLKKSIHLLKRDALGLRNQEEDVDGGDDHHRGEEEVNPVVPGWKAKVSNETQGGVGREGAGTNIVSNIWGVNRAIMKFQNQLFELAKA